MSRGIDCNAASNMMAKKGNPHQTLAMIGPHRACVGLDRMLSGVDIRPSETSQCGTGPTTGLSIQAQLRPDRKLGTAQGRNTRAWTSERPGKERLSSKARTRPRKNWIATDSTVHQIVLDRAFQKLASSQRSVKGSKPIKSPLAGSRSWMSRNA